jgi:putative transposase
MVAGRPGFQQVLVITDGDKVTVTDLEGEILIDHTKPAPGVTHGHAAAHAKLSPMS